MDFDPTQLPENSGLLKWLWGFLTLPLGWLWKENKNLAKKLERLESKVSDSELHATEKFVTKLELESMMLPMKKDVHTISQDLKNLNTLLLQEALESKRVRDSSKG